MSEILIVEDSPTQAERLRRQLMMQQYRVRLANNGRAALEAIRATAPDLVLSDIVMPEMNGYELCAAIKADPALAGIPVVLLTSLTESRDVRRGIECGADSFVRKPYTEAYLLERVAALLAPERRAEAGDGRRQLIDLSISLYEQAVQMNAELQERERQVIELNMKLAQHAQTLESTNREIARQNAELEAANRLKSTFIASVSHELRTPLNAIIGFTGALQMKLSGPLTAEQEKQLGIIRTSAGHLLDLINDILDVAKIEAGTMKVSPEPVPCHLLVQETVDTVRQLAAQKNLELRLELPPDPVVISTDRRAFTQILLNLLANAIKFTEHGGVTVRLAAAGPMLEVAVADTGAGIRPEDQDKLFKAFSQLDSTATRHADGTGLG
ncbi:MAG TPA: response regulator, partial [Telluria sp.]|nr:response regulator [Telluria sp.]